MAMPRVKRRSFIIGSVTVLAGGSVALGLEEWFQPGTRLADSEMARNIGARYAEQYPEGAAGLWKGRPPETAEEWGRRLQQLREEDFEADRLVLVDGWWLAETELRLCVLLHTSNPDTTFD